MDKNNLIKTIEQLIEPSFNSLFNEFKKTNNELSKQELGKALTELSKNGILAEIDKKWYILNNLEDREGYIHWGMGGLCWVEKEDKTNDFGVSFATEENLLLVFNKRKAIYGGYAKGKIIPGEKRDLFFISECQQHKKINLIISYNEETKEYVSLGGGSLKVNLAEDGFSLNRKNGDIYKIHDFYEGKFNNAVYFGNISEKGIEGKIVKEFCGLKETVSSVDVSVLKCVDYLDKPFFSIDAVSTRDIDDAIYVEKNSHGYELFVAIADVSSYIKKNDEIDNQAKEKATTYYLFNETIHMLPKYIAENLCSLAVGEKRLAMICHISYDLNGNLLNSEFLNKKIMVKSRLSYNDVEKMMIGENPIESFIEKNGQVVSAEKEDLGMVNSSLSCLGELSNLLKREPLPINYWFLKGSDIVLNDSGKVDYLSFNETENKISQKMVETAMLEANKEAAKFLSSKYPYLGLYRNQNAPLGIEERPKSAFYDEDNEGHWGLQTDFYTHFTSPIRRYCDLIVHRLIKNVLNGEEGEYTKEEISEIGRNINLKQYVAKQCFLKEKNLLMSEYIEKLVKEKKIMHRCKIVDYNEGGVVLRNSQNIDVFLPKFKMDYEFCNVFNNLPLNCQLSEKNNSIDELNKNWRIKFFIDNFSWLDDKKEVVSKIYKKEKDYETKKVCKP